MKYSLGLKFLAITLCALFLLGAIGSALGILLLADAGLYTRTIEDKRQEQYEQIAYELGYYHAQWYASETLGACPEPLLYHLLGHSDLAASQDGSYALALSQNGNVIWNYGVVPAAGIHCVEVIVAPTYAKVAEALSTADATKVESFRQTLTYRYSNSGESVLDSNTTCVYTQDEDGNPLYTVYSLEYYRAPTYQVSIYFSNEIPMSDSFGILEALYGMRNQLIVLLLVSLALFAATLVYLCYAAGRTAPNGEVRPGGLNRLPLDLYTAIVAGGVILLLFPIVWFIDSFGYSSADWTSTPMILVIGLCALVICLLLTGLIYCLAAQSKVPNGYWWKHSILGWLLAKILAGIRLIYRGGRAIFRMLPVVWQWLLTAFAMILALSIPVFMIFWSYSGYWQFFWLVATLGSALGCICIVCYGAYCFGTLLKGIKYMAQGYIHHQIPTSYLSGPFREFAKNLNSLAGAVQVAAAQQMKSERMKTELITNVSHDIKTPLTSIINYVDLLKMPHNEAEGAQYLEVLDRQSHRLKKLVDDLIEMSKASSGNIQVELGPVDAAEAVNQALGEFADKLDAIALIPVVRHPEEQVTLMADGRLVWRVLSNLLSNAVKYSLPGTRLYVDIMALQGSGIISIKNVSKEALNIDPSELMERFVRGDAARNTDGSGLGLNIAKSLVELQRGQMHLMVDGDLFKVTLVFPLA